MLRQPPGEGAPRNRQHQRDTQSASIKTSEYQSALDYLFNSEVIKEINRISCMYLIVFTYYLIIQNKRGARERLDKNTRAAARPL